MSGHVINVNGIFAVVDYHVAMLLICVSGIVSKARQSCHPSPFVIPHPFLSSSGSTRGSSPPLLFVIARSHKRRGNFAALFLLLPSPFRIPCDINKIPLQKNITTLIFYLIVTMYVLKLILPNLVLFFCSRHCKHVLFSI